MEELRDERLSKIMSWMQSYIRGYLCRKDFKKLQEQRLALEVVQRNLRKYLKLRTWPWWKLWQKVKPLLNVSRVEDQIAVSIYVHTYVNFCNLEKLKKTKIIQMLGLQSEKFLGMINLDRKKNYA
jgi:myosin heavy subunit